MIAKFPSPNLMQAISFAKSNYPVLPIYEPLDGGCSCGDAGCTRPGKHPRTANGIHDATTNLEILADYWDRWPEANLAIVTGSASGLTVIDVDGSEGYVTLERLTAGSWAAQDTARVFTGRGEHIFVSTGDARIKSRKLGPGLDLRGDKSYVVAARSLHISGKRYRHALWGKTLPLRLKPATLPPWLKALLFPAHIKSNLITVNNIKADEKYVRAALRDELERLGRAVEGTRNDMLNLSTFRLGQLVGDRLLCADEVSSAILQVALKIGLGEAEARATILSGLQAGQHSPRRSILPSTPTPCRPEIDPLAADLSQLPSGLITSS